MEGWIWVTGGTRLRSALKYPVYVAISAPYIHMRASQMKSCQAVVEGGVRPIRRIVTRFADSTKRSVVLVILLVAGIAIFWRAFEAVYVALFARHIYMLAFEREVSQAVVKLSRFPANGCVA